MINTLENVAETPAARERYEALDSSIRSAITFKEWSWLSDAGKNSLVQQFTELDFDV